MDTKKRKNERVNVKYPMWRKKVDSSFYKYQGTYIPSWVSHMWNLDHQFHGVKKSDKKSQTQIVYNETIYSGNVSYTNSKSRPDSYYRLWYCDELSEIIQNTFIMSYIRSLENGLQKDKSKKNLVEYENPFWEFIDIEYDFNNNLFIFTDHYVHKPSYPELFKNLVTSPVLKRINNKIKNKNKPRILPRHWQERKHFISELNATNVVYYLIDTKSKKLYVGEATNLIPRFIAGHPIIKDWNYYKYDILPDELAPYRKEIQDMMIRNYATLLTNTKNIESKRISKYTLVNDQISGM